MAGDSVVLDETSPLNRGQNISTEETLVNGYFWWMVAKNQ